MPSVWHHVPVPDALDGASAGNGPRQRPSSGHGQEHGQEHDHDHDHGNASTRGTLGRIAAGVRHAVTPHSHDAAVAVDRELETSRRGMRALFVSFLALTVTAALQAVVVGVSGSVALLGDTVHNAADALTAVPIAIAFTLGRRAPTRRYTYGYGRAEDVAGIVVVLVIAASAGVTLWEALRRLAEPRDVEALGWVAVAGVVGFLGNEAVAQYRIRVGREIGSAALVADGLHARTDGFTSLGVLAGAGGVALGWRQADPVVALLITAAILLVLRDAAREVYRRLMDAVDPATVDAVEATVRATPGVLDVGSLHLRWIGHSLRAEAEVVVDAGLSLGDAHRLAHEVEHRLLHEVPRLSAALVHAEPSIRAGTTVDDPHETLRHHRRPAR
jgi:cation diffusion facilitator family transporter